MKFGVGQSVHRLEDPRLLKGAGQYVDDITLPDQAHAVFLRSPVANGRITGLDVGDAAVMPGVLAIWTHRDIVGRLTPLGNEFPMKPAPAPVTLAHLARDRVRFVGQPVAVVFATSREAGEDAAEAIIADFEELEPVTDPEAALRPGAPLLHEEAPGNLAYRWECGDAEATNRLFADAARIVSSPILNQRIAVAPMEPRAINVRFDPETGRWEAWVSCQGAHRMRAKIARALGVDVDRVRVRVPDVGGAFGMKLMDHPEYGLCALAARDLARPVKWVGTRAESFLCDAQARDMRGTIEGAFDADGICRAIRLHSVSGLGAHYSSFGTAIHTAFSAPILGGMYRIEAIHAEVRGAFTNTPPMDAYRGAGRPETIHATERLMDAAAQAFDVDQAAFRRRNLLTPDMLPHHSAGGFTYDSLDTHRVLDAALARADYAGFEARAEAARIRGAHAGIGVAYFMERTGGAPSENSRIELGTDGRLRIWIGTQTTGQGHATTWAQIAREKLGIAIDCIEVMPGDSDALSQGGGTGGSRSTVMASRVILLAADDLVEKAQARASEHLEAAPADIAFSAEDGGIFRIAGTDRAVGLVELAAGTGITAMGEVSDTTPTFPNGCHVAEVEIDAETGALAITRYSMVDDFGRLINPRLVGGQIHGGVVQGIGQVICEQAVWDPETGQPLTGSFMDYALPRASDVPPFDLGFEEIPCRTNPLGVKGCGEAGAAGGISSTALAVRDALRRAGAKAPEAPYTPFMLWQALSQARA